MASTEPKYDLYSPAIRADPQRVFAEMREQDPVCLQAGIDGETPIWFVTRYEDVSAVLLDDVRFVRDYRLAFTPEEIAGFPPAPAFELIESQMLSRDGAEHRRLRRLVTKAFTPRMVEQLRPRIQTIADELIEAVQARGTMDLSAEYALPLPITVIAELLGVPVEDQDRFRAWSDAVISPIVEQEDVERLFLQMGEFGAYLADRFAERRASPRDDLLSALLTARDQEDALDEMELFGTVLLLMVAGHETTVGLIGNAVLNLLSHPDQLELVRSDLSLYPAAIEELLRYESPVERALNRWAAADVELGGKTIKRGELVMAVVGSANRDSSRFETPDRLDLCRADTKHLSFGRGSHYCLGAPLARLEAEIALETLFRRLPGLRLAVDPEELEWRADPGFRRVVALPVAW